MDKKYVVYQHVTPDELYYFGATSNIKRRWEANGCHYKGTALQPYIEKYGWDNIKHIVLFRDQTRENALWIEDFLIETAREDGVCINKQRSGYVSKEDGYKQRRDKQYYEQNKQQILKCRQEYYEENKDKKLEYQQQYYEENKDKRLEYQRKNREKINEQRRQRYQKNREKINEQRRQLYQRKKEEQQFEELGCLPLW